LTLLAGCGSGGSGSSTPPIIAPSGLTYPVTSVSTTIGVAITTDTPSVNGTSPTFFVGPTLPTGLSFNSSTGTISGTPTVVTPTATYTVTASNSSGATSTALTITVAPLAPSALTYPVTTISATIGIAISTDTPTVVGTSPTFSVSPALPAGLGFNSSTGTISGTPTVVTPTATYTVTATNSAGSTSTALTITVAPLAPSALIYPVTTISATVGIAISTDTPTVVGTSPTFSVSPALPAGLGFNSSTGTISGTPTVVTPKANYTITAMNFAGSTNATLSISVSVVAPSALTYPVTQINATVGTAITPDTPTFAGSPPTFVATPALPAGLSLNSSTGTISGTPAVVSPTNIFTITATNSAGSTTAVASITINPISSPPGGYSYNETTITAAVGDLMPSDIPLLSGTPTSFSVSPALPAGLTLNTTTGVISGSPTVASANATYTFTATNPLGSATTTVAITILPSPNILLKLGQTTRITELRETSTRVLSQGTAAHWALSDFVSGNLLAEGDQNPEVAGTGPYPVDLAGNTLAIGEADGVDNRSAIDGHLMSVITFGTVEQPQVVLNLAYTWWKLSSDGSYIVAGGQTGVGIWSTTTGALLYFESGNYYSDLKGNGPAGLGVVAFASPSQVLLAAGPAGQNVLETISISTLTSTVAPPFSGTFNTFFGDGSSFITSLDTTVWLYSAASVQENFLSVTQSSNATLTLGGVGNWFWAYNAPQSGNAVLSLYTITAASPNYMYQFANGNTLNSSALTLGMLNSAGTSNLSVIDLSGTIPATTTYSQALVTGVGTTIYAAYSAAQWVVNTDLSAVVDGSNLSSPRFINLGQALSIAGATSTTAIATASGNIYLFNPEVTTPTGIIFFPSSKLQLSSDGTVLAGAWLVGSGTSTTDASLKVFSLPSAFVIAVYPYTISSTPNLLDFSLSGSGTNIGQVLSNGKRSVMTIAGSWTIWSDSGVGGGDPIEISPDGTLIAVSYNGGGTSSSSTNIYTNGVLTSAVSGFVTGWIDNSRLLTNTYVSEGLGAYGYGSSTIYSSAGASISTINFGGNFTQFQTVNSGSIYIPVDTEIFSLSTGLPTWTTVQPVPFVGVGAVTSSYVIYASGTRVLADQQ